MKNVLLSLSLLFVVACVDTLETGQTSQEVEVIVVVGTPPPDCAQYGNYENVYDNNGMWTGCRCFAFCNEPGGNTDPGGDGGGGGGGGGGGDDGGDDEGGDENPQDLRNCLGGCAASTAGVELGCLRDGTSNLDNCVVVQGNRCLGARDMCRRQYLRPDGQQPMPEVCKLAPKLATCQAWFAACEGAWMYGPSRGAHRFRNYCSYTATLVKAACNRNCLRDAEGMLCDASIEGEVTVNDGRLDDEGRCWGENSVTDCAMSDSVDCEYGSEAGGD
jgi:hypothetical protein